jgi:hypothetical protein
VTTDGAFAALVRVLHDAGVQGASLDPGAYPFRGVRACQFDGHVDRARAIRERLRAVGWDIVRSRGAVEEDASEQRGEGAWVHVAQPEDDHLVEEHYDATGRWVCAKCRTAVAVR